MKIKFLAFALSTAVVALAAPLASTTAVHTKPDASSPAITVLNAGTDPVPVAGASAPAGWMAVELPGPFELWIETKDLTKNLDVKPGASMRLAPRTDAGVIALGQAGDDSKIIGYKGRWTQISLEKKLVGYINVGRSVGPAPVATTPAPAPKAPGPAAPRPAAPAPVAPAPVAPGVYGAGSAGQPAPMVNLGDGGASTLPRQFVGRLASTQSAFRPRRPYDYALNDDAGKRYAYVDISKLLQTEQIEKFVDHPVVVFGAAKNTPDGKDIVIVAESLQLK